nr:MAG TPA: hypothetical protein [Caudoviricetes sp.]
MSPCLLGGAYLYGGKHYGGINFERGLRCG